jgi:hypothetical protein
VGYRPHKKAALLIPFNEAPHLFVVLNDPDSESQCLLVMATSIKKGRKFDAACELAAGCHSFIKHPTFMLYRMAACSAAAHIGKMVDSKYYQQKSDVSQALYDQIRAGLYDSDETPQRIIAYARAQKI